MSSHGRMYWIKLYVELINDEKVGPLNDSAFRRFIECLCLAGELDEDGFLPSLKAMAWKLRLTESALSTDLTHLAANDLLELRVHSDGSERWFVTNFTKRQAPSTNADRQRQWRQRNSSDALVTKRYDSVTPETETETETEEREIARAAEQPQPLTPAPLPPVKVKSQISDRTPGGNGYRPPADPPPQQSPPKARELTPEQVAVADMANALTEVTGVSAKLNWPEVGGLAGDLVEAGYTAQQVITHYGKEEVYGNWNWYTQDWRGRDKGDRPRLKEVRETIAGATVPLAAPTKKKINAIERALAMFGPQPQAQPTGG